jgi:hypothetical protein
MSFIADLSEMDAATVLAVGWLHPDHPYARGESSPEFLKRLKVFARLWGKSVQALGWGVAMGYHTCEFCGQAWGSGTFGVPDGGRLFFVPELIPHYVEAHGYAPLAEFVAAVLASPLPGTPEYGTAVRGFAEGH